MIRFIKRIPKTLDDYNVIFNGKDEIRNHIGQLCEESVPFDTIILRRDNSKFQKERAFSFFVLSDKNYFLTDILNPLDTGAEVLNYIKNLEFKSDFDKEISKKLGFLQFIYSFMDIQYTFFALLIGYKNLVIDNQKIQALKFAYPDFIKKFEKRDNFRVNLTLEYPVEVIIEGYKTRALNISAGGIAINTKIPRIIHIGEILPMTLTFPNGGSCFIKGMVKYLSSYRAGIQFIPSSRNKIDIIEFKHNLDIIRKFVIAEQLRQKKKEKDFEDYLLDKKKVYEKVKKSVKQKLNIIKNQEERKAFYEIHRPTILVIDNIPGTNYDFLKAHFNVYNTHYIKAEVNFKINSIEALIFNPDYSNYKNIIDFLVKYHIAKITPKIIVSNQLSRDFILFLNKKITFDNMLKFPPNPRLLINSLKKIFHYDLDEKTFKIDQKIKDLKFAVVSNVPFLLYHITHLLYSAGIEKVVRIDSSGKIANVLSNFSPEILIIDNIIDTVDALRMGYILKKNPAFKNIKIFLVITEKFDNYLELIGKYNIDRFIFFPFNEEEFIEILESFAVEF